VKLASQLQYTIDTKNQNSKTTYLENTWIHPDLIFNQQELLEQANTYSSKFQSINLNCVEYLSNTTNEIIGIICTFEQGDETTFEMFRIFSGISQIDAIPNIYSDKQALYNQDLDHFITLFKHCTWSDESLEEANTFSC